MSAAIDSFTRHVTGSGRFTADLAPPETLHAVFVRSDVPHGEIRSIELEAARAMTGVVAILTVDDLLAEGVGPIPTVNNVDWPDGRPNIVPPRHSLAKDRVRHVGEPVVLVVAETHDQAEDAAEAVSIDIDPLPFVTDALEAARNGAPQIWSEAPGNRSISWEFGDAKTVADAFASAETVVRAAIRNNRIVGGAMEPRAALARFIDGRYDLITGTQGVFGFRKVLAEAVLGVSSEDVRVRTFDVGGGFGTKTPVYPEYAPLLIAAKRCGRPVLWTASRSETFLADNHGRDSHLEAEMALDEAGRVLAVKVRAHANVGAYLAHVGTYIPTASMGRSLGSVYLVPAVHMVVDCLFTNTQPVGPYRGAGRPEANLVLEQLMDRAAHMLGLDRVEIRRRNLIPPGAMPYRAASGLTYDSGDFEGALDKALEAADWRGFEARAADAATRGRLRGIGLAMYLEATGGLPTEAARFRFSQEGELEIALGTQATGQSHEDTYPQIVAARLGLPRRAIRLVEGDTDLDTGGGGSVGSRSTVAVGTALAAGCDEVLARAGPLAADHLEADARDLVFEDGRFNVVGTDRAVTLLELARENPGALDGLTRADHLLTFPNGCHIAEIEIDSQTGAASVVGYVAVDDVGRVLNRPVVEGQVEGGTLQGIGQALFEEAVFDDGQLLAASFQDYAMPRATEAPTMCIVHHEVPAATNPLGVKGAGEGGTTGALPTMACAIADALHRAGAENVDMPATPMKLWRALRVAAKRQLELGE